MSGNAVKYDKIVSSFLTDLTLNLVLAGYFHYYETSMDYVLRLVEEIESTIHIKYKRSAPPYFSRYGKDRQYITCKRNRTTWYIFFTFENDIYYIRYITNNHVAGHFLQ